MPIGVPGAEVVGSAWVTLGINSAPFAAGLFKAEAALSKFGRTAMTIVGVGGAFGLALGLKKVIDVSSDFQQAMAMVRSVTLATGKQFQELTDRAKELGRTTKWTMVEIAKGEEALGRLGLSTNEIIQSIGGVSDLAASQMIELAGAADMVGSALRIFNLEAKESTRVADVFAFGASASAANVSDMFEAMSYSGPIAAAMKISIESLSAAIAKLSDRGIRGSSAGTVLRYALGEILEGAELTTEKLKPLGLQIDDFKNRATGAWKDMAGILETFEQAGADAADMMAIFGVRAGPGMVNLMSVGSKALREMTLQFEEAGGTAARQAEIQLKTFQGQMKIMESSLELAATNIGEWFLPILQKITQEGVVPMVNKFVEWADSVKEGVVVWLAKAYKYVVQNADAIKYFLKIGLNIGKLVMLVWGLTKAWSLLSNPLVQLVALAGIFYFAWEANILGVQDLVRALVDWIKDALNLDELLNDLRNRNWGEFFGQIALDLVIGLGTVALITGFLPTLASRLIALGVGFVAPAIAGGLGLALGLVATLALQIWISSKDSTIEGGFSFDDFIDKIAIALGMGVLTAAVAAALGIPLVGAGLMASAAMLLTFNIVPRVSEVDPGSFMGVLMKVLGGLAAALGGGWAGAKIGALFGPGGAAAGMAIGAISGLSLYALINIIPKFTGGDKSQAEIAQALNLEKQTLYSGVQAIVESMGVLDVERALVDEGLPKDLATAWASIFEQAVSELDWQALMDRFSAYFTQSFDTLKYATGSEGIAENFMRNFLQGMIDAITDPAQKQRLYDALYEYLRTSLPSGLNLNLEGGQFNIGGKKWGGAVTAFAEGGGVPGMGLGDKIPALLEPGEFVVPNWMMRIPWFSGMVTSMWRKGARRFAEGGAVAGALPISAGTGAALTAPLEGVAERTATTFDIILDALESFITPLARNKDFVSEFFGKLRQLAAGVTLTDQEMAELTKSMNDVAADLEKNLGDTVLEETGEFGDSLYTLTEQLKKLKLGEVLGLIQGELAKSFTSLQTGFKGDGTEMTVGEYLDTYSDISGVRDALTSMGESFKNTGIKGGALFNTWKESMLALAAEVPAWEEAITEFIVEVETAGAAIKTLGERFAKLPITDLVGLSAEIKTVVTGLKSGQKADGAPQTVADFLAGWESVGDVRSKLMAVGEAFKQLGIKSGPLFDAWVLAMRDMAGTVLAWEREINDTIEAVRKFGESLNTLSVEFSNKTMLDLSSIMSSVSVALSSLTSATGATGAGSMKLGDFLDLSGEVERVKSSLLAVGTAFETYGIKSGPLFDAWNAALELASARIPEWAKELEASRFAVMGFSDELKRLEVSERPLTDFFTMGVSKGVPWAPNPEVEKQLRDLVESLRTGVQTYGLTEQADIDAGGKILSPSELLANYATLQGLVSTSADLDAMFEKLGDSSSIAHFLYTQFAKLMKKELPPALFDVERGLSEAEQAALDFAGTLVGLIAKAADTLGKITGTDLSGLSSALQAGVTAAGQAMTGNIFGAVATGLGWVLDVIGQSAEEAREKEQEKVDRYADSVIWLTEKTQDLARAFGSFVESLESYQTMMSDLQGFWGKILDALFGGFFKAVSAISQVLMDQFFPAVETATEVTKKSTKAMVDNLNVPTGWKVDRIRYEAAVPGQPPVDWSQEEEDPIESEKQEVVDHLKWLKDILKNMGTAWTDVVAVFQDVFDRLKMIWEELAPSIIGAVLPVFQTVGDVLLGVVTYIQENLLGELKAFFGGFGEWWKTDVDPFLKSDVFPALGAIALDLYGIFKDVVMWFRDVVWNDLKTDVWPVLKEVLEMLADTLATVFLTVKQNWPDIKDMIIWLIQQWGNDLKTKLENFKLALTNLGTALDGISQGKDDFWTKVWSSVFAAMWSELWKSIFGEKKAKGGYVGGAGTQDTVPALLTPGEFVVPRWMMSLPGVAALIEETWRTGQVSGGMLGRMPLGMNTPPSGTGARGFGTPAPALSFPGLQPQGAGLSMPSFGVLGMGLGDVTVETVVEIDGDRVAKAVSRRQARKSLLQTGFELATEY